MTTTTTTTHHIAAELLDDRSYCITINLDIVIGGRRHRLGFSPAGRPGRKVYEGPLVPELFGWLNEEAIVIAAHPLAKDPTLNVNAGDLIVIESHGTFVVLAPTRWPHLSPRLEVVA